MRSEAAPDLIRLAEVAQRARPVALAREHVLPVLAPLEGVLPGGLRRGSTVGITDSTSLALALLAGPVQAGSWVAAVGVSSLGLAAAAELGVALERLVLVADPPSAVWASTVATLVDAFDAVLVRPAHPTKANDARRLAARARERGSVLFVLGGERAWPEAPDVRLGIERAEWTGLGVGHGHLRARRVVVTASGRRGAAQPRRADLWLPAAGGGVAAVEALAEVRPFRLSSTSPA